MSAIVTASGTRFDVDAFLKRSKLKSYRVWHRGDSMQLRKNAGRRLAKSGCSFLSSGADFHDFEGQIRQTIHFLSRHERELRRLRQQKGVTSCVLDFGINWKPTFTHTDRLPEQLVSLAGRIGLEINISHYPLSRDA